MPLEDLDRTPPPSGANTPTFKQRFDICQQNSSSTTGNNPFENPDNVLNTSTASLNTPDHPTILTESSEPSTILSAQTKQREPPPPQPLGLPKPRTPPPRNDDGQVYITDPPDHTAEPSTTVRSEHHLDSHETKEAKWWTEWLCGCSEGPDRGGYNQARSPSFLSRELDLMFLYSREGRIPTNEATPRLWSPQLPFHPGVLYSRTPLYTNQRYNIHSTSYLWDFEGRSLKVADKDYSSF